MKRVLFSFTHYPIHFCTIYTRKLAADILISHEAARTVRVSNQGYKQALNVCGCSCVCIWV